MILNRKQRYLQIALNGTLEDAQSIIAALPKSDRILVEAGTPLIKRYGEDGIRSIVGWYRAHLTGEPVPGKPQSALGALFHAIQQSQARTPLRGVGITPYVVADLKMMDRGTTEVEIAARAGASAAVALGLAPLESLQSFIDACVALGIDSMVDMMNVDFPLGILHKLARKPDVVILHRGVDEEQFNKEKQLPLHEIRRIKSMYDSLISIAGGDTIREVQRAIFNDADIVVVWKSFYQSSKETGELAQAFLDEIH
jgi:bifunctional enzyme Fae/Hps